MNIRINHNDLLPDNSSVVMSANIIKCVKMLIFMTKMLNFMMANTVDTKQILLSICDDLQLSLLDVDKRFFRQ